MVRRVLSVAVVLILVCGASLAAGQKKQLRMYVFTKQPTEAFTDPATQRRLDSTADVKKIMNGSSMGAFKVAVVEDQAAADLSLEITDARKVNTGRTSTSTGLFGSAETDPVPQAVIRVTLRVGDYSTELESDPDGGFWRIAAQNLYKTVRKWVQVNEAKLLTPPQ